MRQPDEIAQLNEIGDRPPFHFGTLAGQGAVQVSPVGGPDPFSYEELSLGVLVWHATCRDIGQNLRHSDRNGKRKDRDHGKCEV